MEETKNPVVTDAETPENDKAAQRAKNRKRYLRELRSLIIRTLLLLLVVYILFFHLVGITVMPNADMYPRIDAGDLVLFYRLEKSFHAQDVIVFEKPTASLELTYEQKQEMQAEPEKKTEPVKRRKKIRWLMEKRPDGEKRLSSTDPEAMCRSRNMHMSPRHQIRIAR